MHCSLTLTLLFIYLPKGWELSIQAARQEGELVIYTEGSRNEWGMGSMGKEKRVTFLEWKKNLKEERSLGNGPRCGGGEVSGIKNVVVRDGNLPLLTDSHPAIKSILKAGSRGKARTGQLPKVLESIQPDG